MADARAAASHKCWTKQESQTWRVAHPDVWLPSSAITSCKCLCGQEVRWRERGGIGVLSTCHTQNSVPETRTEPWNPIFIILVTGANHWATRPTASMDSYNLLETWTLQKIYKQVGSVNNLQPLTEKYEDARWFSFAFCFDVLFCSCGLRCFAGQGERYNMQFLPTWITDTACRAPTLLNSSPPLGYWINES